MITFIDATVTWKSLESVLFQPVLKAYPTCHSSWIITAHVSLGNLEKCWRMFIKQMEKTQQLLNSIQQKPLAPTHVILILQAELTNLDSIYMSYRPLILAATQLLKKEPSFDRVSASNRHTRRSLLPFLGDALSWLMGTATTMDVSSIKSVNQMITAQNTQQVHQLITAQNTQEMLVHIISVLNVTRYATWVNRQHINIMMDTLERTHQDVTTLCNFTSSLYNNLSYQQIMLHICSILANLQDSLYYMREVAMHTMEYKDAATTGILSPYVLPVEDLRKILLHIEEALPSTMHLPVSSEDTIHFYRYLHTHVMIADEQFLLLIDVPIQDCAQQLEIYEVFNLVIPQGNFSAHYNINCKYLGITYDDTKAVEISEDQFSTCQKATRQLCSLNTHLHHFFNHLQIPQHVQQHYMQGI